MHCSRRTTFGLFGAALLAATTLACSSAQAHRDSHPPVNPHAQPVRVTLETETGAPLDTFFDAGDVFVAGETGQRYNIRVENLTAARVEAVVTVDGRDVVSGELGNYKKQRGYVIDPFSSVVIEGFRQSLTNVAAFRFTSVGDSYSARRGTPQHVGVVGVAVFSEKAKRSKDKPRPITTSPFGAGADEERGSSAPAAKSSASFDASPSAPEAEAAAMDDAGSPAGGAAQGFAPPPNRNNIGTQYGETMQSSVRETTFKRKKARKPDAIVVMYYDTRDGLRARGIRVDGGFTTQPVGPQPAPFQNRGFAQPPPR
ncbi:MAG: hypothetical protein KC636_25420 [Myxococcales bacterium]|nr:hypothetical protein [Myxococcales bacterium]